MIRRVVSRCGERLCQAAVVKFPRKGIIVKDSRAHLLTSPASPLCARRPGSKEGGGSIAQPASSPPIRRRYASKTATIGSKMSPSFSGTLVAIAMLSSNCSAADSLESGTAVVPTVTPLRLHKSPASPEYREQHYIYSYHIVKRDSGWAFLETEFKEISGWARADDFIALKSGASYFTDKLKTEPPNIFLYSMRARCYRLTGEIDKALSDCDEAVRLFPARLRPTLIELRYGYSRKTTREPCPTSIRPWKSCRTPITLSRALSL